MSDRSWCGLDRIAASWTRWTLLTFIFSLSTWYWVWPIYSQTYGTAWAMNVELYNSFVIVHGDQRFWLALLLLPTTCIGVDVALKYAWRRVKRPDKSNRLRFRLQEVHAHGRASSRYRDPGADDYAQSEITEDPVDDKRQKDAVRRRATADFHRVSFAAVQAVRLTSGGASPHEQPPAHGISSSVLGRDDDESNRRGAEMTFGKDYLLPQKSREAVARMSRTRADLSGA